MNKSIAIFCILSIALPVLANDIEPNNTDNSPNGFQLQAGIYSLSGDEICQNVSVENSSDSSKICLWTKETANSQRSTIDCFIQKNFALHSGLIEFPIRKYSHHDSVFGLTNEIDNTSLSINVDADGMLQNVTYYSYSDDASPAYPLARFIERLFKPDGRRCVVDPSK